MTAGFLALLLSLGAAGGAPQTPPAPRTPPADPSAPVLLVAARDYLAGGEATGSYAGSDGADAAGGFVWSDESLCANGASVSAPTPAPATGWRYAARITERVGDEFVVSVEWRREWDRIGNAAGRNGTSTVRLRLGDRYELDRVTATTVGLCRAASLRLEVAIVSPLTLRRGLSQNAQDAMARAEALRTGVIGAGAGGAGSGRGGAGAGGTGGRSVFSGRVATSPQTSTAEAQSDEAAFRLRLLVMLNQLKAKADANRGLVADIDAIRQLLLHPLYQIELWLVHTRPDKTEETVRRQKISFDTTMTIVFPAVVVPTSQGPVSVQVTGFLSVTTGKADLLQVRITRRVTGDGPPPLDNTGSSDQSVLISSPDDVLSFELPPVKDRANTLLAGHQFALRLRVVPPATVVVR